jgi:hypothetical protein
MTAKLALARRISALETLPTAQKPLRIRGGLPEDPRQALRATVKLASGHVVYRERDPIESVQAFIARIHTPGCVVTIGGMPPLPTDHRLLFEPVDHPEPLRLPA